MAVTSAEGCLEVIAQVVNLPLLKIHDHLEVINPVGIGFGKIHGPMMRLMPVKVKCQSGILIVIGLDEPIILWRSSSSSVLTISFDMGSGGMEVGCDYIVFLLLMPEPGEGAIADR